MKFLVSFAFFIIISSVYVHGTLAYNPTINTTIIPYKEFSIDSYIKTEAQYLGELTGDPQMYEFSIGSKTNLVLKVSQLENKVPIQFSLIVVKQNNKNGGVVEIGRMKSKDIKWEFGWDSGLGLSLMNSQLFESEIDPGLYRFEVSTPENFGKYMVTIGEESPSVGYFATLADVRTIQKFFGKSVFRFFLSSYVYYPLGATILIVLLFLTWRNRQLIRNTHA